MTTPPWTPADLLQLSGSYWSACALHAGVRLDLFTPLAQRPMSATELAKERQSDPRATAMLLTALVALGLLTRDGEHFTATPFAATYLARSAPAYLGHIISHHHHLVPGWSQLDAAVRRGGPVRERVSHGDDNEQRESFLLGMFNLASLLAPRIAEQIDLRDRRRLLDLGGGPGTYAIHFCRHNPQLTAVVYDLPTTRPFAETTIARFDLSARIGFQAGDFLAEPIAGSFDVAWLSHILHGEGTENARKIVARAAASLEPGGLLLVQEFILDDSLDGPLFPALFALNMLIGTPDGQAYRNGELLAMLTQAGLEAVQRLPVELPNGAGIICGRRPA